MKHHQFVATGFLMLTLGCARPLFTASQLNEEKRCYLVVETPTTTPEERATCRELLAEMANKRQEREAYRAAYRAANTQRAVDRALGR